MLPPPPDNVNDNVSSAVIDFPTLNEAVMAFFNHQHQSVDGQYVMNINFYISAQERAHMAAAAAAVANAQTAAEVKEECKQQEEQLLAAEQN